MNMLYRTCTLIFMGVLLLYGPVYAAAPSVDSVQAVIVSGQEPPELVRGRMEKTVAVIAEQLIAGKPLSEVEAGRAGYERIIHEVFDKVLVGYSVRQVTLAPGERATVRIELQPWAQVIRDIRLETEVEGMPPLVETLVRKDLWGIGEVFRRGLDGLPVAAADWTNGVLKRSLNEYMEKHLPEFRADFDLSPDSAATVKVTVYPRLPVVRSVDLNMRSDSIPNFTLLNHRDFMEKQVGLLTGVPVKFVERHAAYFASCFERGLDKNDDFKALGIKTKVTFKVAENLTVMSRSDTTRFRVRLEGWADIGRRRADSNRRTMFRLHVGQNLTHTDEIFVRADFYPQDVSAGWALGYNRHLTPTTELNTAYDMKNRRFILGAKQRLAPRWLLRYEYRWSDQMGEVGLRYKMHDFLGLELVHDKNDNWLRLIGNF